MTDLIVKCTDNNAVRIAAQKLRVGDVIAIPTDTVYGLACNANNHEAIRHLYDIKGRNESKPVAICVPTINDLRHWSKASHLQNDLLEKLLPGAVTIVLRRSKNLDNPYLNNGIEKIGIRIPKFEFIQRVSEVCEFPIALTSANRSSEKSTLQIGEFKSLWPHLGIVFDGGQLGITEEQRAASTVIDLSEPGRYSIIRNGIAVCRTVNVVKEFGLIEDNL
ncbi:YrdC domain-containing protein, mitochondrial [Pseudolycoriella hygida]|uniref:Threonylcarbamoyl-AMP synthase n=1 Tax=Pseudolycoriella hygida TaxID=35572 RepID=A0A9Q0N3S5_9DIPT|nr:YrdC domain-containing protein, mitochondrial [Pseudolycoriella hygida]